MAIERLWRIQTDFYPDEIESLRPNWRAADLSIGGLPIGWGKTEIEAIRDLLDQIEAQEPTK